MNAQSRLLVGYADELQDFRGILNDAQIELFISRMAALISEHFPAFVTLPDSQNPAAARPLPELAPVRALIGAVQIITDPAMRETVVKNWVYWSKQLAAKADAAEMALREAGK